jgi:cobalt/nickel transport system permease protein
VGAGHTHKLHVHGHSVVHRLPAHVKLLALLLFMLTVVATPREAIWAFLLYAGLLAIVAAIAGIKPGFIARRMVVEIPFLIFALLLPFIATGPKIDVLGIPMSENGLWGAWNLIAKATLGVVASILLAATTEPRDVILGLQRLRVPQTLVQIMAFMVRYIDVIGDEMQRMRIARESRAFEAKHLGQLKIVAHAAGALFIRSYERGERVHLAMLSRGYTGSLPAFDAPAADLRAWAVGATLPVLAVLIATIAWMTL